MLYKGHRLEFLFMLRLQDSLRFTQMNLSTKWKTFVLVMHWSILMYLFSFKTKVNHQLADSWFTSASLLEHSGSPLRLYAQKPELTCSSVQQICYLLFENSKIWDVFQWLASFIALEYPKMPFFLVNSFAECWNKLTVLIIGSLKDSRGKQVWIYQNRNMAGTKGHFLSQQKIGSVQWQHSN